LPVTFSFTILSPLLNFTDPRSPRDLLEFRGDHTGGMADVCWGGGVHPCSSGDGRWRRLPSVGTKRAMTNNAMHTDSAGTIRFWIGHYWRGAGDGERWASIPNEHSR
jgi:hypothetical protein